MVSPEISMFGFYPVVIGAFLAIGHAQFPGENWQGGIHARDTFQRPLFSTSEQSRLTELIQNLANTQSNVQLVSRNSLSAKNQPLPRKTSYGKSYGSLVKRSADELQSFSNKLSRMPTDLRHLRIKRQAPGFQVWDFHPSSLVRRRLVEAREQSNRNKNVPNNVQRSSTELIRQESSAPKSRLDPLLTERQVISIPNDLKLQPAEVNIHLPEANYNAITQESKRPLKIQAKNGKNKGKIKVQKTPTKSSPKKKTGAAMKNNRSNIVISKNTKITRSKTQPGPKYSNRVLRTKTSPKKQFDFTAAALIGKETGPKQQHSNNRNQISDHGLEKADGIGHTTASQYLKSNDVLLDIKALNELIDRTTKILLKQKGLTDANAGKHTLNSKSPSDQRPMAASDPRQRNGQIVPARASNTFEKKQQRQGQRTNMKVRVKPAHPQNQHKKILVPQPNERKEDMPLQAQNGKDQLNNAQLTNMQKETPIKDTKQTYLQLNRQQMLHAKMEPTQTQWTQSQNKEGMHETGRKSSGANIPLDRNLQHNQNSKTKTEPTFALLQQKQPQQKEQMLSNKIVKTHEQIRQSMSPQEQTHGKFMNLLLNDQKQVFQEAAPVRPNLQQFGEVLSATTQQPVEPAALQQPSAQEAIFNDFGTQTHNPKTNRRRQKELLQSKSIKQTQQERTMVPIHQQTMKHIAPLKLNQRRFRNKMSNTRNILPLSNEQPPNQMPNTAYNLPLNQEPVPGQMSNTAYNRPINQEPVPGQMSNIAYNLPLNQEPVPGQMSNTAYNRPINQEPVPGKMPNTAYNLPLNQEPVPGQMSNTAYNLPINQEPVPGQMSNTAYNLPINQEPVQGQMSNTAYNRPINQEPVPGQMPNTAYNLPLNQEPVPGQMSNTAYNRPINQEPVPGQMSKTAYNRPLNQEPVPGQMSNTAYNLSINQEPVPGQMSNTAYNRPLNQEAVQGQMSNTAYNRPINQEPVPGQMPNTAYNLPLNQEPVPGQMSNTAYNRPINQEPVPGQMSKTANNLPLNQEPVPGQMSNTAYNRPLNHEPVPGQMPKTANNLPLSQKPVPRDMSNTVYNGPLNQEPMPGQMSKTANNLPLNQEPVPGQMSNTAYNRPLNNEPVPGQMSKTANNLPLNQEPVLSHMSNIAYNMPLNQEPVPRQMSNTVYDLPLTQEPVQNRLSNSQSNLPYTSVQQHLQEDPQQVSNTQARSQQGNNPAKIQSSLQRNINSQSQFVERPMSVKQTQQISDQQRSTMPILSGQTFGLGQKRQMSREAVDTQAQLQQAQTPLRQNQQLPKQAMDRIILQTPTPKFTNRDRQIPRQKAHDTQKSAAQVQVSLKQNKSSLAQTFQNQKPLSMQQDQQYPSILTKGKQTSPTHASHTVQHEQQTLLQQMLGVEILPTEALMTLQQAHEYLQKNLFNDHTLPGTGVSQTDTKFKQQILNPKTLEVSSQKHQNQTKIYANQNISNQASDILRKNQDQFYHQITNIGSKATQNPRLQDPSTVGQSSVPSKQTQFRQTNQQHIRNVEANQPQINIPRHQQQFMEPNTNPKLFLPRSSAAAEQGGHRMKTEQTRFQETLRTTPVPSSFPHKSRIEHRSQPASTHDRLQPVHPKLNYKVKSDVKRNYPRSQTEHTSSSTTPKETPTVDLNLNDNSFQIKSKSPKRKLDNTFPRGIKQSVRRQSHSAANGRVNAQGIPLALDRLLQTDLGPTSVQKHRWQERVTKEEQIKKETLMTGRTSRGRKQNLTKNVVTNSVRYSTISPPNGKNNQPEFILHDINAPTNTALQNPLKPLNVWNPSPDAPSGHPVATNWNVPKRKNRGRSKLSKNITSGRRNDTMAQISSSRSVKGGQYVKNWFNPRRFEDSNAVRNEKNASYNQLSSNEKSNTPRDVIKNVKENNRSERLINSTPRSNVNPQKHPSNQVGRSRDIRRKNRKSVENKHGRRKNSVGKSTQWKIQRGRSGRRPGNVGRPVDHSDYPRNNMNSSQNTPLPRTPQKRLNRGRNRPLRKRPVTDTVRPAERKPHTDSTTSVYATTLGQFNRRNRPIGRRPVKDTARPVAKLQVKDTIKPIEKTEFSDTTTSVYATTLSQFNRLGKHLFDSSGEVGQEVHATVKPSDTQSSATRPSVKWNDWNQSPSNSSNFSSPKASSVPSKKFEFSLNKNMQDTKQSNETVISDTKRNRTFSIKQTIRTLENATQEGQPRAPVNFNVFLGIPTENPRGKASNTVDVLRLLNALSVLRGQLRPPTTILPPVKIVLQVEREIKPSKLRCRCFPKSDGCPSELKEEPLVDMCDVKVSIPCCEDG